MKNILIILLTITSVVFGTMYIDGVFHPDLKMLPITYITSLVLVLFLSPIMYNSVLRFKDSSLLITISTTMFSIVILMTSYLFIDRNGIVSNYNKGMEVILKKISVLNKEETLKSQRFNETPTMKKKSNLDLLRNQINGYENELATIEDCVIASEQLDFAFKDEFSICFNLNEKYSSYYKKNKTYKRVHETRLLAKKELRLFVEKHKDEMIGKLLKKIGK